MNAKLFALGLAGLVGISAMLHAEPGLAPQDVPIERIVKNLEDQLTRAPEDSALRFQLARAHYLIYFFQRSTLPSDLAGEGIAGPEAIGKPRGERPNEKLIDERVALEHAVKAVELFQQIIAKDPKYARAPLGLASLLWRIHRDFAARMYDLPKALQEHDLATVLRYDRAAFEAAWPVDQEEMKQQLARVQPLVSIEAAHRYLQIVKERKFEIEKWKVEDLEKTQETAKQMEAALAKYGALPVVVSPLIFSPRDADSIASLLAPECSVNFDLRGYGRIERWPWLQGDTAILVWDPARTGRITSSRQMFGTYSWQIFWKNGFEALAALDDNHDGWLRGAELEGLSIWSDRNQNAVSDPGEVTPLSRHGVTALACTAPEREDIHPLHRRGVEMQDGRRLPLWDWFASPRQTEPVTAR